MKILMVDDNKDIIEIMIPHFKNENFEMEYAYDGEEAYNKIKQTKYDLILLDVMMPKLDGFSLCKKIRETSQVPIIMITAKTEDEDVIMGLDIGADDYIIKPFSPKQVIAKIKAIIRRIKIEEKDTVINNDELYINMNEYVVKIKNKEKKLTKKEIEILYILSKNINRVFSREMLLDLVWGEEYFGELRTVDTHIKRLRAKVEQDLETFEIKTVRGVGYKIDKKSEENSEQNY